MPSAIWSTCAASCRGDARLPAAPRGVRPRSRRQSCRVGGREPPAAPAARRPDAPHSEAAAAAPVRQGSSGCWPGGSGGPGASTWSSSGQRRSSAGTGRAGSSSGAGSPARGSGGPRLSAEVRELIAAMARDNPRWGSERIRGELLKLGIAVSKRSIQRYRRRGPARPPSQTWRTFLANHAPAHLGGGPVHRADAHVQDALRARVHRARPPRAGARQRHGAPDRRLGLAPGGRGHRVGPAAVGACPSAGRRPANWVATASASALAGPSTLPRGRPGSRRCARYRCPPASTSASVPRSAEQPAWRSTSRRHRQSTSHGVREAGPVSVVFEIQRATPSACSPSSGTGQDSRRETSAAKRHARRLCTGCRRGGDGHEDHARFRHASEHLDADRRRPRTPAARDTAGSPTRAPVVGIGPRAVSASGAMHGRGTAGARPAR